MQELTHVPVDNGWFIQQREHYLNSQTFRDMEALSGVRFDDLTSEQSSIREAAQLQLASRSIILNAIRNTIGDYFCPLTYMHVLEFAPPVSEHVLELDKAILALDMCDSLRRRHFAISYSILPDIISQLREATGQALKVKNLGSGLGMDVINALRTLSNTAPASHYVSEAVNCDVDRELLRKGQCIADYAQKKGFVDDKVQFRFEPKNLFIDRQKADLLILAGIICGLTDDFSTDLLRHLMRTLNNGGALIVTSSNSNMRSVDPVSSLLIQNIGLSGHDPLWGWPLNFRSRDQIATILGNAGFASWQIYDDANYAGRENLEEQIHNSVDCFPAVALGLRDEEYPPLRLPSRHTLQKKIGYNWIAVAWK